MTHGRARLPVVTVFDADASDSRYADHYKFDIFAGLRSFHRNFHAGSPKPHCASSEASNEDNIMSNLKVTLIVGALITAIASFNTAAIAATAHNSQTGAGTSNAYDTYAAALAKRAK